jgi:hypothetical protein
MSDTKSRILDAGSKAVEELILVLKDSIIANSDGGDLAPEKMKTAASAKRLAFDDALYIFNKIEEERKSSSTEDKKVVAIPPSFAEGRAKKNGK